MRVTHVIAGLLSLAGVGIAAPTPQSAAVQLLDGFTQGTIESNHVVSRVLGCASAEPEKWLITICGAHGTTNSIPLGWLGGCALLSEGVAYQVSTTVQQDGLICYFYHDNGACDGEYLIATVARHAEISEELGKRANWVKCERKVEMEKRMGVLPRGEDTPHEDAQALNENASLDIEAIVQADETPALDSAVSNCPIPDSRNHFLNVCAEGTHGNAFPDRWIDTCVELSPYVAHHVSIIVQKPGLMCRFYDGSNGCNGIVRFISKTLDKHHRFEPPAESGKAIKYALCRRGDLERDAGELEAREADASLDTNPDTTPHQLTQTEVAEVTTSANQKILMAKLLSSTTSIKINMDYNNKCITLIDRVTHDVKHSLQMHSTACMFYASSCDTNTLFTVAAAGFGSVNRAIPPTIGSQITHVKCISHLIPDIAAREEDIPDQVAMDTAFNQQPPPLIAKITSSTTTMEIREDHGYRCLALIPGVTRDVKYTSMRYDTHCGYSANGCGMGSTPLVTVWPRGYGYFDQPLRQGIGKRATHVYCTVWNDGRGEMPSLHGSEKLDAREGEAEESDLRVVGNDTPGPKLEFGQLRIGEDVGDTHVRGVVGALNGCVDLPAPRYPNSTRTLDQSGRSDCEFYSGTACAGAPVLYQLNSDDREMKLRSEFAQGTTSAKCTILESISPPTTRIPARDTPPITAQDIDILVPSSHSATAQDTPFLKVADLYLCNDPGLDPAHCTVLHTLNDCVTFPGPYAYQAKMITQAKGSFCKYYTKPGCIDGDEYFRYMSNPRQDAQISGWGVAKLAGVWCGGTGAASTTAIDTSSPSANSASPSLNERATALLPPRNGNPFYHWTTTPGSTTICRAPNYAFCTNNAVNALHACVNFAPEDQGPASLIQYAGAWCKWFRDVGCVGGVNNPVSMLDSRKNDKYADGLLDARGGVRRYKSVRCERGPW